MSHRFIIVLVGLAIIATVVGVLVYPEWPGKPARPYDKPHFITTSTSSLLGGPGLAESAVATFAQLTITPLAINAETPTEMFAEVVIPDKTVIPSSVLLHRLDAAGKIAATIGNLNDAGSFGDSVPGDSRYSLQFTLRESVPGATLRFRASAALQGVLRRVVTSEVRVLVLPPVQDSGPVAIIRALSSACSMATDIERILPFFSAKSGEYIRDAAARGVTVAQFCEGVDTAQLQWQSGSLAEFAITQGGVGGRILLERLPEGWRIVEF